MGTCSPAHHSRWSKNWHLPGKSLPFPPATLAPGGRTDKVDGHGPKESASGGPQQLTPSVKAGVQDSGGPGLEPQGEGAVRGAEPSISSQPHSLTTPRGELTPPEWMLQSAPLVPDSHLALHVGPEVAVSGLVHAPPARPVGPPTLCLPVP